MPDEKLFCAKHTFRAKTIPRKFPIRTYPMTAEDLFFVCCSTSGEAAARCPVTSRVVLLGTFADATEAHAVYAHARPPTCTDARTHAHAHAHANTNTNTMRMRAPTHAHAHGHSCAATYMGLMRTSMRVHRTYAQHVYVRPIDPAAAEFRDAHISIHVSVHMSTRMFICMFIRQVP